MNVRDKTVVITGATSGIGYELVRRLAGANTIVAIARPSAKLDALSDEFPSCDTYPADLAIPDNYQAVGDRIMRNHPHIDILFNNAAVQHTPTYLDDDFAYETILYEIHLNFAAVCALSYLLLPALLDDKREAVIAIINSGLALAPKTGSAVYCATKAAMNSFSQSLEYQLEETNIKVIQSFLPLVDTPMTKGRGTGKMSARQAAAKIIEGIQKGTNPTNIGKVKLLRLLLALWPGLARKIMKGY